MFYSWDTPSSSDTEAGGGGHGHCGAAISSGHGRGRRGMDGSIALPALPLREDRDTAAPRLPAARVLRWDIATSTSYN